MVEDIFEEIRKMEKGCHGYNSPIMAELLAELEDDLIQHIDRLQDEAFSGGYHRGQTDFGGLNAYRD